MSIKSIILAVALTVAIGGTAMAQAGGNGGGGGGGGGDGNPSDASRTPVLTSPNSVTKPVTRANPPARPTTHVVNNQPINQNPNGGSKHAKSAPSGEPCAMMTVGGRQRCDRPGRWTYVE